MRRREGQERGRETVGKIIQRLLYRSGCSALAEIFQVRKNTTRSEVTLPQFHIRSKLSSFSFFFPFPCVENYYDIVCQKFLGTIPVFRIELMVGKFPGMIGNIPNTKYCPITNIKKTSQF